MNGFHKRNPKYSSLFDISEDKDMYVYASLHPNAPSNPSIMQLR